MLTLNVYLSVCGFRNPPLKPRLSHPLPRTRMNETYAVVNKPKLQPPSSAPHSVSVHYYDNANSEKSNNNAVYSTVKPKNRPTSFLPPPTSPVYDRSTSANQRGGLSPKATGNDGYELLPGKGIFIIFIFYSIIRSGFFFFDFHLTNETNHFRSLQ